MRKKGGRDRAAVRLMTELGIRYQAALAQVKERRQQLARERQADPT